MQKIQILVPTITTRLKYTFDFIWKTFLQCPLPLDFVTDPTINKHPEYFQISYHKQYPSFGNCYFHPHQILLENQLVTSYKKMEFSMCEGLKASFWHKDHLSELPFDPFALIFYLISRYEEYLTTERDHHQRFVAQQSHAHQHGFLQQPLVDLWIIRLRAIFQKYCPSLPFGKRHYRFLATYDIDYAYAFRQKSWWRQVAALGRNILRRDTETLRLQWKTWRGKIQDPFDTFDYLHQLYTKKQQTTRYFFLVGDYGKYDKNIHYKNPTFRKLIQKIADIYPIGLHPSYASNQSLEQLLLEKKRLEEISNQEIKHSRQHFLRVHLPTTYQNLLAIGIQEDYSMGYANDIGFRASTAQVFNWFDLHQNKATLLKIHPFQLMDVTLNTYLKLSPKTANDYSQSVRESTQAVEGQLVSIWHNNSFCEAWQWWGWRQVYEDFLDQVDLPRKIQH
ncbi:MAG: polysaccharide deacetylase family protein [Saprospiraceae bacterium]|nr:polysaccharide deacetylase family protein [Saprospiraceae bacterium]